MSVIIEWITSNLAVVEPQENLYKLNNLNKCINVKTSQEIYPNFGPNCRLSINGCEESNIYIDSAVSSVLINSCVNCTIFIAAVGKTATIEKCEGTTVIVAANQLRIGNCVDTSVHSYTPKLAPIIYGDTRNLRMAPHNAMYSHFIEHLKMAKIPLLVDESVSNF